jgi:hypothetical protein
MIEMIAIKVNTIAFVVIAEEIVVEVVVEVLVGRGPFQ